MVKGFQRNWICAKLRGVNNCELWEVEGEREWIVEETSTMEEEEKLI